MGEENDYFSKSQSRNLIRKIAKNFRRREIAKCCDILFHVLDKTQLFEEMRWHPKNEAGNDVDGKQLMQFDISYWRRPTRGAPGSVLKGTDHL